MYEIVTGIDDSEDRARAQAKAIADMPLDHSDIHVTILHDFTDNPEGASVTQVPSVRRATEIFEDVGIEVTQTESSGDPAKTILETAEREDADLIVVAGRKRTPTGKVLFGSVTQSVVLGTEIPVLVCSGSEAD